jgi:hypothetical protein
VRIKRERDEGAAGGGSIKKAKVEVIVIEEQDVAQTCALEDELRRTCFEL